MKKVLAMTVIILVVLVSCKKTEPVPEIAPDPPKEAENAEPSGDQCFAFANDSSTIELSFNVNSHQEVNGKLSYKLYGKDKNEGTLIGNIKGDTLIADYTFMSEGISSVREVAFLQKDGTYIEGYGDITEANGKVTFKDKKKLKFEPKMILTKVDCKVE
ncbi:hypothetical protein [Flavobacterium sp. JAS]|uniref:hypothetical protein n=1 Tax=Flavobacterium sp. JAS TaxID=2897329 RepID=UPI001E54F414|nr:hypothetical protein [Flavobacterium sp. JAS]MCD0468988.1 hypothetical protein [Flavobacterium sp. JAS]